MRRRAPGCGETEAGACSEGRVPGASVGPRLQERRSRRGSSWGGAAGRPSDPAVPCPTEAAGGSGLGTSVPPRGFSRGADAAGAAPSLPAARGLKTPGLHETPPGAGAVKTMRTHQASKRPADPPPSSRRERTRRNWGAPRLLWRHSGGAGREGAEGRDVREPGGRDVAVETGE